MKILHLLGHKYKWPLDAYFQNNVGDGFIFCAYSFKEGIIGGTVSGYGPDEYLDKSLIDFQFYGNKKSIGGKLDTYKFHPINNRSDVTNIDGIVKIFSGIEYQHRLGLNKIIIPSYHYDKNHLKNTTDIIIDVNKKLDSIKRNNTKYYMTLSISSKSIVDDDYVEKLLQKATGMEIGFDGYYIACEPIVEYKKKVSIDYKYYTNLLKILKTLKMQGFETIYAYANWDALIFYSLCEIDYITIGTYENIRNFSLTRFTEEIKGGLSKGWYFSEKLLNFIRSQELVAIRTQGAIHEIANEYNIFSDAILDKSFEWNTHKPEVQKNYLLAISRLLDKLRSYPLTERSDLMLNKIQQSRELYEKLEKKYRIYLQEENSGYHLGCWTTFIKMHQES